MYSIQRLSEKHLVHSFDCGVESKNRFLQKFALQNAKGGLGRTYVAVRPPDKSTVFGYYTISSSSVKFENLPTKNLPRYPVPSVLIGKLAIDKKAQGQGLGSALLFDALKRAAHIADEIGVFLVEVKAIDQSAKKFYSKHEFTEMQDSQLSLFLSLKKIRNLLRNK